MSGICAIFRRNGAPATIDTAAKMLAAMRHRGPDGEATWSDGPIALGHCMLHVTPESLREHLPAADRSGDYAITADARIDNRRELVDLLSIGCPESEVVDSDLILAAYRNWGEECPKYLLGDFAFAVWDRRRQTVFCACDPMGVKSLYYHLTDHSLIVASEVKAILPVTDAPCELNELRIAEYLVTLFEDRSGTFYKGVLRLPGASALSVTREHTRMRQYWSLDPQRELRLRSEGEYAEAFRSLFTEAVRCRTRSAFPVGAALSGGLDSSSVACVARDLTRQAGPLRTFSLVFPELPEEDRRAIDERPEMNAVLNTGGFAPHFIQADRLSPMWQIERMHFHLDHANCAPNLYLHWAMYDAARSQGVRVFLDGFDGDGAVSHGFERLTELARTLRWRSVWREVKLLSERHLAGVRPKRIIKEYCVKPLAPRWACLAWQWTHGRRREAQARNILISPDFKRRTGIEQRAREMLESQYGWSLRRTARQCHWLSISQALYAYTLEIADKATAAFQIEARYPFFDRRVLEFCLALPASQKLAHGWNRWILRNAMTGVLPPEIQWRPRKGNLSPNFHRRLLDFERRRLEDVILNGSPELTPFVDPVAMRSAYLEYEKNHARSKGESIQLFAAVNLALWLRARPDSVFTMQQPAG